MAWWEALVLKGELLNEVVPIVVFLIELFSWILWFQQFSFFFHLCLQEPPEDDANIIEKILASKTVQEVGGLCFSLLYH